MNITIVEPSALSTSDISRWKEYQRSDPALSSPFFCLEYIHAVSAVRSGVRIARLERDGEVVGFFPFQRTILGIADRVGLRLCDLSGLVIRGDVRWDPESLVRRCGLSGWHFQNLIRSDATRSYEWTHAEAPYLDLSGGFEQYKQSRQKDGSALFEEIARKARKLHREVGPLRFEFHTAEDAPFETLMTWKAEQRKQTKTVNVLSTEWAQALMKQIGRIQTEEFAGVLSVLYAGDQLAAVHMGMRSRNVLHYWIPSYNASLSKYSPGSILLLEIARTASDIGITRLDLGAGKEQYKLRFKSGALSLGFGSVNCNLASTAVSRIRCAGHKSSQSSAVWFALTSLKRAVQRAYYRSLSFGRPTRFEHL